MKTKNLLTIAAIFMALFILSSCGIMRKDDFATRKYTHFKKGETALNISNHKTEKEELQTVSAVSNETNVANLASNSTRIAEPESLINITKRSEDHKSVIHQNKQITQTTNKVLKLKRKATLLANSFTRKANTTSITESNYDTVLLVILAIFLPPLAVYLVKDIGNEFWIDILLCILFWLPGVIYALIVVLD